MLSMIVLKRHDNAHDHARYTDNDNAKTLVFPCHVTHVVLADPPPLYLGPSKRSGLLARLKERIEGSSRFLFSRHEGIHFTTIDMLRTEIGNESGNRRENLQYDRQSSEKSQHAEVPL